ncbi:MAG: LysR family transcriptional regulator [Polyangiaceae bacterium]
MDIPWDDLKLFLAVAETGSLSAAARRLRVAQPTVSRRLADLESRMGGALFARSVDGAKPTAFGDRLLVPARRMAEWAVEVERAAEGAESEVAGVVRLTAPPGVAFDVCAPFAASLRAELPKVRLEVMSSVQYLDLVRREADLALRAQEPSQRDLVTLASIHFDAVPFASRAYAAKLAKKARVEEVDWIGWAAPLDHLSPNRELARLIPGFEPVFASDDFLVQLRACEAGLGAMFLGRVRHRFTRASGLVPLPVALPPVPASLYLVCARNALAVPRIREVAERLTAELSRAVTER